LGILTVGIVTTPFAYEGKKRIAQAEEGIMALKSHVDTLLVISNDKLRHQFGNLKMKEAFAKADNVLATAAKCITDVINSTGQINVDFADVCTVMSNGGVAILGSASAEGENRAQAAIENALNSPLLNDNDIRGAKWILININSAEGDHEFTMDEVEIIQNYLLSHAGEETDVILGLGYDSTLGSSIGITLIATGFEHKDPFPKATQKVEEVKNEKIVMTLNMPAKENKVKQATLQLEEKELYTDNPSPITDPSSPIPDNRSPITDPPSPTTDNRSLITDPSSPTTDNRSLITDNQSLITDHQSPTTDPTIEKQEEEKPFLPITYLTKPAQIYLHEEPLKNTGPVSESLPLPIDVQEDEPVMEMQLVVKDFPQQNEDNPLAVQTSQPASNSNEEAAVQDDTEELRRRATERIAKLRNLSFNTSAADHNNEFETVPAYLRRNMELHNSIANVESFYSSYTVKSDENNQAEISTINTFLEGKKPD
jgi:cell division protein FtsZ